MDVDHRIMTDANPFEGNSSRRKHYILVQNNGPYQVGTLWYSMSPQGFALQFNENKLQLISMDMDTNEIAEMNPDDPVEEVDRNTANILLAISERQDRLEVYQDKEWLEEGKKISNNDTVELRHKSFPTGTKAYVRYTGPLPGSKGTQYGIELHEEVAESGTTDGVYRNNRFFTCGQDRGLFVSLHKIRYVDQPSVIQRTGSSSTAYNAENPIHRIVERSTASAATSSSSTRPPTQECVVVENVPSPYNYTPMIRTRGYSRGASARGSAGAAPSQPELYIAPTSDSYSVVKGDRVVWPSDDGPKWGTVQWVGHLPGAHPADDVMTGIEFDDAVGSGTGMYRGQHVFQARKNHASFVPLIGLIKEADFGIPAPTRPVYRADADGAAGDIHDERGRWAEEVGGAARALESEDEITRRVMEMSASDYQNRTTVDVCTDGSVAHSDELQVNMRVKTVGKKQLSGTIRWIGNKPGEKNGDLIAGLEMDTESPAFTSGEFKGERMFECPSKRAFFTKLSKLQLIHPVEDVYYSIPPIDENRKAAWGNKLLPPPVNLEELAKYTGNKKGIQGRYNSCYLDTTLMAMFSFVSVFDEVLLRPRREEDIGVYEEVQKTLIQDIVNPLREGEIVPAAYSINRLRIILDTHFPNNGWLTQEKDPEEFIECLFGRVLKADPFLTLSSDSKLYCFQLFMEKDPGIPVPTVERLLELAFIQSDIQFQEAPSALILQMPRFGKSYRVYERVLPSLELDITDILKTSLRECMVCGELATWECKECHKHFGYGLDKIAFCDLCNTKTHNHPRRNVHRPVSLRDSQPSRADIREASLRKRDIMELFAVVCIQTSHYVAFLKFCSGDDSKWLFYDSMADRIGNDVKGHCIPKLEPCPEIDELYEKEQSATLSWLASTEHLTGLTQRFICDSYVCFYQHKDRIMYQ